MVLADAARRPNLGRELSYRLGTAWTFPLDKLEANPDPLAFRLARWRDSLLAEAEDRRLLYVALTRAQEKLILSGHLRLKNGDLLADGCWFINGDEMKTLDERAYRASLDFWVRHVESQADRVPPELVENTLRWRRHFEGWKRRNIERIDQPKTKGDDLHEPFVDQVRWLREVGFEGEEF